LILNFNRSDFLIKKILKVKDIKKILKKNFINFKDLDNFEINDISSLYILRENSIIFIEYYDDYLKIENSKIIIITNNEKIFNSSEKNTFLVSDISDAYNCIVNNLFAHDDHQIYNDNFELINGSYISKQSNIHSSVSIGKNCIIGRGVQIKSDSIIKNNVVIKNSIIGSNVIICDNSTIGSTGFGFDFNKRGANYLNPQIGIVFIDNNCHIGSNCTIDRAKIDITYIGKNCMLDNLIHIAHNVEISDNACIAAQTGISGSVKIGKNVTIGGQSGFAGHINIGDNVVIAAKSGVTKNLIDNSVVAGFPAIDIKNWKRNIIRERKNGYK